MIRKCTANDINQIVDLAFAKNNQPEHNCAYCYKEYDYILQDFLRTIESKESAVIGYFNEETLIEVIGILVDEEKSTADCCGPFVAVDDFVSTAKLLFDYVKNYFNQNLRYNFYFDSRNREYLAFMNTIDAKNQGNECWLALKRENYSIKNYGVDIVPLPDKYIDKFVNLHDSLFQDVYLSGKDIIKSIGKSRRVFCVIEDESLIGYSVFRRKGNSINATAEVIGVDTSQRRKGYGRALLNELARQAFYIENAEVLNLVVDNINVNAMNLYYSFGFELTVENCAYCKDFRKTPKKEASFITKMVTTEDEINKVTSMAASSPEQNQYLKQAIQDGNIKLEDCYILKYNNQIVARAIIMNDCYLSLYTLEDIEKEKASEFLANVLKRYPNREFTTDLYSDKKNYSTVYSSLLASGFKDIIQKESYTIQATSAYEDSKLTFKAIDSADEELLVELFTKVVKDNKDSAIIREIKEKGLYEGSRDFFLELKQRNFERELWIIAYCENKPVGFIILQRLTDSDAGISYIGIVPEYRGNHFSQHLLLRAINLAHQYKISKIIADIDVENYPMRNNLLNCGFKLDCTEKVFIKQ